MAKLDIEAFSEEYQQTAPMECATYLVSCLDKNPILEMVHGSHRCNL